MNKDTIQMLREYAARYETAAFPDDPLRGDFALFGYGVNH